MHRSSCIIHYNKLDKPFYNFKMSFVIAVLRNAGWRHLYVNVMANDQSIHCYLTKKLYIAEIN